MFEHTYGDDDLDKDALTALNGEWKDVVEPIVIIIMVVIISCHFLNHLSGKVYYFSRLSNKNTIFQPQFQLASSAKQKKPLNRIITSHLPTPSIQHPMLINF